jgi:uncharacterized protein (DUF433 family)
MQYENIITVDPGKLGGKPCTRGLRFSVYDVADYLASGMTIEQLLAEFPFLTLQDLQAAFAYFADENKRIVRAA